MSPNLLITSAGRRGKLVAMFQQELHDLIPGGQVYAADRRPDLSVACQLADGTFSVLGVDEPDYISQLREICRRHDVGMIVPTIDTELETLARSRKQFAEDGVEVVVSDAAFVTICRDKRKTMRWLMDRNIDVPRTVDPSCARCYPIFAKPFDGSCAKDIRVISTPHELTPQLINDSRMMFLEYLTPAEHDEYTLDMYYSRNGELQCLVPRLRIETRAGEVSKGRTARIEAIECLRGQLSTIPGARGCITLQIFVAPRTGRVCAIEINPRFGGGYPLSYEAGANFPRWLIEEYLLQRNVEFNDEWECDLVMLRYDEHVVVRGTAA